MAWRQQLNNSVSDEPAPAGLTPMDPPKDNPNIDAPRFENCVCNLNGKTGVPFYRNSELTDEFPTYCFLCNCNQVREDETPHDTYRRLQAAKKVRVQPQLTKTTLAQAKKQIDLTEEKKNPFSSTYSAPKSPPQTHVSPPAPQPWANRPKSPISKPTNASTSDIDPVWFGLIQNDQKEIIKFLAEVCKKYQNNIDAMAGFSARVHELKQSIDDGKEEIKNFANVMIELNGNLILFNNSMGNFKRSLDDANDSIKSTPAPEPKKKARLNLSTKEKEKKDKEQEDIAFIK